MKKNIQLSMRPIIIMFAGLLIVLQYSLWFSSGGIVQIWHLKNDITTIKQEDTVLTQRNTALQADVQDLKQGKEAIEERARNDLGMIKNGETFYQLAK